MSKRSLIIAAIVLAFAGGAQAATLTVTNTSDGPAPGPVGSLRRAISDAASGDTINFSLPANSSVALTSGELLIEKHLTISGPGANLLSVRRSASQFRIFFIQGNFNVTLSGLTIANGFASDRGGGIYNVAGTVTITNSTISGNGASYGGGIYNATGTVTITNSTISANRADYGGGIYNDAGTVTITNSTVYANSAGYGGGIYNSGGTMIIINSTISGNTAHGANGGGISNSATLTITNSTISGNSALEVGGGISNGSGTLTARNTIVAGNTAITAGPDFFDVLTSQGYNLIGNTSETTIAGTTTGNQLNVDPKLGPLQDNGGPSFTHALQSGSPAIEAGKSFGSNTDQRGFARPVDSPGIANAPGGDGSDIGAYEVQADLLPGCNTINRIVNNNNDSGAGSLRAVIANVCAGTTITFAAHVRGVINLTDGELLIDKTVTISGPGANLLTVQRSAAAGTQSFRIFHVGSSTVIATIAGLTIANGNTAGSGGGIQNTGTLTLANATISGNRSTNGGGVWNTGTLTVVNSTISGNTVSDNALWASGGGVYNGKTLTITNSTISGNTAFYGGGIYNEGILGKVNVTNSTISANSASRDGGGIYNFDDTVNVTSSTISANSAGRGGGGIANFSGKTLTARNTIIAGNTAVNAAADVEGALTSQGYNLIGNHAGATIAPALFSDQIGTAGSPIDPLLGPLQGNGGPDRTHALLSGSRAIDKGHSSGSSTDQRGFSRPADNPAILNASDGDGGDIGAIEFGGAASSLKILSISRVGNGPVVLQVAGFPHGVHRIQASVDLSFDSFIDVATVAADAAGRFQYQDTVAGLANFYRVAFP